MAFDPAREGQLTEQKLNWGYWWVTHKVQVRQAFSIFLLVIDLALVGYAGFGFADWFFGSGEIERRQLATMSTQAIDYAYFRQKFAPEDFVVDSAVVLGAGEKTYDFIARSSNPNPHWWVEFDFRFESGSGATQTQRGYLLPGETKFLNALGVKSDVKPGSAKIVIENVVWKRVNFHMTRPDYATWAAQRQNFVISDVAFVPPDPQDPIAINRAKFTVLNDTGFGYFKVGFFVTLLSGSRIVGVNKVVISDLRPGDRRAVDASWFFDLPGVSKVEVRPELNIFDERVYIPPGQ